MPSDITYNVPAFDHECIDPTTARLNAAILRLSAGIPKWHHIGAAEYRSREAAGKLGFPPYNLLPRATELVIEADESIHPRSKRVPCRVLDPEPDGFSARGVFLHIHGGGFVLGSAKMQDNYLAHIADETKLKVISIEYRQAPEDPFPAANDDCAFVAKWLIKYARAKFGCDLYFIGGESCGATLTATTILALRAANLDHTIRGLVFNYGCFDLSLLPSARLPHAPTPFMGVDDVSHFAEAYMPGMPIEERKSPLVSPAYNDLSGLGSALFIVGTEDVLMDDSVLMHSRWIRARGNEAEIRVWPGAPHGFMIIDASLAKCAAEGWAVTIEYLERRMQAEH